MACPVSLKLPCSTHPLTGALVTAAMVASLLTCMATALGRLLLDLPLALLAAARTAALGEPPSPDPSSAVRYYTGTVRHVRRKPVKHEFRYPVRTALVNLNAPPAWWGPSGAADDHLSADEARAAAGVVAGKGAGGRPPLPVWVLTSPPAAGYAQNPISVYYVWDGSEGAREGGGRSAPPPAPLPPTPPARALAVVTNTPWGARVHFAFDPRGDKVTKCLHVSPFMDMEATWLLSATPPGHRLHVAVGVDHPALGRCFDASLDAACDGVGGEGEAGAGGRPAPTSSKKSAPTTPSASARSERGSLATLLAYGYMPHRTAAWIYWQGARLWLQRGLRVWRPPARGEDEARIKRKGVERREGGGPADTQPVTHGGHGHAWTPARVWPWSVQQ